MKNILLSTLFVGSSLLVSAQKKQAVQAATPPANYLQLVKEITPQLTTWRRHFHDPRFLTFRTCLLEPKNRKAEHPYHGQISFGFQYNYKWNHNAEKSFDRKSCSGIDEQMGNSSRIHNDHPSTPNIELKLVCAFFHQKQRFAGKQL